MAEIIDLCKAEPSRNFRNSRLAKYDRIIECVRKQREEFVSYHDQVEVVRKERAAIIESIVKKLKELDIKSNKPLGKYDNDGLIAELNRIIDENPDVNTEDIEIAIVKIKNRYRDIQNITKKLKTYSRRIDNYPDEQYEPLMEADYGDEILITKDSFKTKDTMLDEADKVVEKHEASPGILESLANIINNHQEKEEKGFLDDIDELFETKEEEKTLEEEPVEEEVTPEADEIAEEEVLPEVEEESIEEYASFTLGKDVTLQNIVKHVYEETDGSESDDLWVGVYNFGDNQEKIDALASELEISVDDLATTPGLLNGLTLKFPTALVTYRKVEEEQEENLRRVA